MQFPTLTGQTAKYLGKTTGSESVQRLGEQELFPLHTVDASEILSKKGTHLVRHSDSELLGIRLASCVAPSRISMTMFDGSPGAKMHQLEPELGPLVFLLVFSTQQKSIFRDEFLFFYKHLIVALH